MKNLKPQLKQVKSSISDHQISLIDEGIKEIALIINDASEFRKQIAEAVVELKRKVFGGKDFSFSGYEENFLLNRVADAIGFTTASLKNWISVLDGVDNNRSATQVSFFDELTFTDKLAVMREIRQNKKKTTEAIKDFYSDKKNPVKRRVYYLERYVNSCLATARGLEDLCPKLTKTQTEIIGDLNKKILILRKILSNLVAED